MSHHSGAVVLHDAFAIVAANMANVANASAVFDDTSGDRADPEDDADASANTRTPSSPCMAAGFSAAIICFLNYYVLFS